MKQSFTPRHLVIFALGASISLLPLAASAQTTAAASPATTTERTTAVDDPRERTHYGWIGLLGLLGLAGLLPKKREVVMQERTDLRR